MPTISSKFRNRVSFVVLGLVGAIFVFKYSSRAFSHPIAAAAAYFLIFLLFVSFVSRLALRRNVKVSLRSYVLTVAVPTVLAVAAVFLFPERSDVSRLPAIAGWLSAMSRGHYPYGIAVNPSAFPGLFLIASPFFLAGNLGLVEVAGIILFAYAAWKLGSSRTGLPFLQLAILLLLPTTYYELITRSELLFNMSLVAALLMLGDEYIDPASVDFRFVGIAVLFGLALSTRSVVGLLYAPYVVYKFRLKYIRNAVLFSGLTVAIFFLTLLPFMIWNMHDFVTDGPFAVQFGYVSTPVVVVSLLLSILVGFGVKNLNELFFFSGVILFGLVLWALIARIIQVGFGQAIFVNKFDVGYFIFSIPFLILSVCGSDAGELNGEGSARMKSRHEKRGVSQG